MSNSVTIWTILPVVNKNKFIVTKIWCIVSNNLFCHLVLDTLISDHVHILASHLSNSYTFISSRGKWEYTNWRQAGESARYIWSYNTCDYLWFQVGGWGQLFHFFLWLWRKFDIHPLLYISGLSNKNCTC